jgi:hypothetical protein
LFLLCQWAVFFMLFVAYKWPLMNNVLPPFKPSHCTTIITIRNVDSQTKQKKKLNVTA